MPERGRAVDGADHGPTGRHDLAVGCAHRPAAAAADLQGSDAGIADHPAASRLQPRTSDGQLRTWQTVGVFRVADGRIAERWPVPFDHYLFDEPWS